MRSVHPSAILAPGTVLADDVYIGPGVLIGFPGFQDAGRSPLDLDEISRRPTYIGRGSRIHGHAVICSGASVGENVRIDYHCLLGEAANVGNDCVFEYGARVYDRVHIGQGSTIGGFIPNDCVIGRLCTIQGSLVHKRVHRGPEIAPCVGDCVFVGTSALIIGDLTLATGTYVAAGAIVSSSTNEGRLYRGAPARDVGPAPDWLSTYRVGAPASPDNAGK